MSKMGISTYQSYCGAQIFEAVGLNAAFVDKYFTGTASNIQGIGLSEVAAEAVRLHELAFGDDPLLKDALDAGGEYQYRARGEEHMWTPDTVAKLQHAARAKSYATYKDYAKLVNDQTRRMMTLRGLFEFKFAAEPVPLDEVEPAAEIVKRFATGAMSLGSISTEAHTTLAVAMNRIGGKSNTGEGGEDARRYALIRKGETLKSRIRASSSTCRCRKAIRCARASSRWLRRASASPPNTWSTPTSCRSRWRRARSPAKAASCPATRSREYIAQVALLGAGRRVDLAAAASRHLFDRGPGAAHPRPQEREPAGVDQRQARVRSRRGNGRRGRGQGQGRPRHHRRPRRRHRRVAANRRSSTRARRGSWACPKRSRRWC